MASKQNLNLQNDGTPKPWSISKRHFWGLPMQEESLLLLLTWFIWLNTELMQHFPIVVPLIEGEG